MDKLMRRVRMAERQVARRTKKQVKSEYLQKDKREFTRKRMDMAKEVTTSLKAAIAARHEAWELGPIAPRREVPQVGFDEGEPPNEWGAVSVARALSGLKLGEKDLEARCAWAGGSKYICLARGDRVVVMEGAWKGKIDKVLDVDIDTGMVKLEDAKVSFLFYSVSLVRPRGVLLTWLS
jgi:large subunit ribosomal protein L24